MSDPMTTARVSRHPGVDRLAALAGAGSTVAVVAGSSIADTGGKGVDPTMGPDGILRVIRDLVGELQLGASIMCLAAVLLLVFLGPLWRRLRTASEPAAVVAVAGGVLAAGLFVDYARDTIALATAAELGDGVTAQVLTTAGWETARILAVPFLAMVAAAVVAGIGSDAFPAEFRWFSVAMLVPLVLAFSPVGPAGLLGLLGTVWVLVASLVLAADPR